jgi:hypothetical protein
VAFLISSFYRGYNQIAQAHPTILKKEFTKMDDSPAPASGVLRKTNPSGSLWVLACRGMGIPPAPIGMPLAAFAGIS